jgi:NAD(P)-dependent dehydrogenase (short-subunit alcohol dehydrogenase family)
MSTTDSTPVPDYPKMLRLDGQTFVVVGGGYGMGRQSAHALAGAGADVACLDVEADRAAAVAAEVDGLALTGDAADAETLGLNLQRARDHFGSLSGICDVVGMARWSRLTEMDDNDWDWSFTRNLRHAYLIAKIGGALLSENGGGSLAFVASISGLTSAPYHAAYGAAKAGLVSLVRTAAVELAPANVRVNAVAPGGVATPRMAEGLGVDLASMADGSLEKAARMSDIAASLLFLSSDLAAHITGHTLVVDGGLTVRYPIDLSDALTPLLAGS